MFDVGDVGVRVRMLRTAAGMTQTDLSRLTCIDQTVISQIEKGKVSADGDRVQDLARALKCTVSFLKVPADVAPAGRPWLRAYADAPKKHLDQVLANCDLAADVISRLSLPRLPDAIPPFTEDLEDESAIEQFALEVRAAADIDDDAVVGNVIRAAERLGCTVLPMEGELGRHLGLSLFSDLHPTLCVSRPCDDVPGDRQRFTVAHELGHLGLHRGNHAPSDPHEAKRMELQAHRFAGAFLIPGDALREEVSSTGDRVTLRALTDIKSRWGIAIKALVVRCRQLDLVSDDHARSLYKQISSRGWNKGEPVHVGHERALWLGKAIDHAGRGSHDPVGVAAERAGIDRSILMRWTDWTPASQGEVVDLPVRDRPAVDHEPDRQAQIVAFGLQD